MNEQDVIAELVSAVNRLYECGVEIRSLGISPESFDRVWFGLIENFGVTDQEGVSKTNHIWIRGILFYRHPAGTTPANSVSVVGGGNVCCDKCGRRQGVVRFICKAEVHVLCPDCGPYRSWAREEEQS